MKERVKTLRKFLKLNQMEFSHRLGIGNTALSKIELGDNPVTEQNVRLICLTFGVNEEWLRIGKGEMFNTEKTLSAQELIETYRELYPENQKFVLNMVKELLETQYSLFGTTPRKTGEANIETPTEQGRTT